MTDEGTSFCSCKIWLKAKLIQEEICFIQLQQENSRLTDRVRVQILPLGCYNCALYNLYKQEFYTFNLSLLVCQII